MWLRLRQRLSGRPSFRRQHAVGPFILDFYCAVLKLAVEIDGQIHFADDNPERDARRTAWLNAQGIEVLRIPATAVLRNADEAAEYIWHAVATRLANPPHIP